MDGDPVFKALADPSRRHLLDLLFERDGRTLSELESGLEMTRFGVMKHLRLLEGAGLITTRRAGREKLHYLNPVPIRLIYDRWIDKYTAQRAGALAALKAIFEGDNPMTAEVAAPPAQVYQVFIQASPEKVWQAITSEEFTVQYFYGTRARSDWKPGSQYGYYSSDGSSVMVGGEVLEAEPPRRLVQTWREVYDPDATADAPSRVTWEIEAAAGGVSKLTVTHDGFNSRTKTYENVAGGWSWVLSNLKTLLETGQAFPSE